MRRSIKWPFAAALLSAVLVILPAAASAATKSSSGGKPISCTPKTHVSRWTDVKGSKTNQSKVVTVFPKGSGMRVHGICRVLKKGLGKSHLVFRTKKLAPKPAPPKPPTIVIGDPPPDTFPPAPPVAPPAPPVAPPAPPTPPPAVPQYSCDGLVYKQPTGNGVLRVSVLFTALNGAVFQSAAFYPGTTTPGGVKDALISQVAANGRVNFVNTYDGAGSGYQASATVTFRLPDGSLVTTDASSGHCSGFVTVPVPQYSCGAPRLTLTADNVALVGVPYTALNRAVFDHAEFLWGDTSSNTTNASSNNEVDFAHQFAERPVNPIVIGLYFRVPYSSALQSVACSVTIPDIPVV